MTQTIVDIDLSLYEDESLIPQCEHPEHGNEGVLSHDDGPAVALLTRTCPHCNGTRSYYICAEFKKFCLSVNVMVLCLGCSKPINMRKIGAHIASL